MTDDTSGMGAEVGVKKMEDGDVTEARGSADTGPSRTAWVLFFIMLTLDVLGIWKLVDFIAPLI